MTPQGKHRVTGYVIGACIFFLYQFVVAGGIEAAHTHEFSVSCIERLATPHDFCPVASDSNANQRPLPQSNYPHSYALITSVAYASRAMDFYHDGVDSSVHIVDRMDFPSTGVQRFHFPAMTANLTIIADGVILNYTLGSDLTNSSSIFADVNVPTDTTLLKLEYDQLDSAIAFEGLWYLGYDWVWGPVTMTVHLPTDASIVRYEGANFVTELDSHTLQFVIPGGTPFYSTVVYSAISVPNLYDTITTPHFQISLPSVYRQRYGDVLVSLLENAYVLYSQYSGQDVNRLADHTRYDFYFPPGGWYWWGTTITLGGGLTVLGGPSAVSSRLVPNSELTVEAGFNLLVAIVYHELGNGWWLLMSNGGLPGWVNGEGHSGFLRSQAELDMNYCADAQREHQNHYQDYLQCMQTQPPSNRCTEEIILISLLEKYGWQPFRNIYASVWDGSLNLNGLSDNEKDSQMVLFFSQQVKQDLVSFFRSQRIYVSPEVESALGSLPVGNVPIVSALSCRPLTFRYTPSVLQFTDAVGQRNPEPLTVYVSSPVSWTVQISPTVSWLSVTRSSDSNLAYLTTNVNTSGLESGLYSTSLILDSMPAISNSPSIIPVTLALTNNVYMPLILKNMSYANLVQNPSFEDGSYNTDQAPPHWAKDVWLPTSTLVWDNTQAHSGSKSVRLDSLSANDIRWIQTVSVHQNTNYRLSGWIKTANVVHSEGSVVAGANLGLFGTWDHTSGLFGTNDWTFASMEFNSGTNTTVTVACRLGYWSGTATGTVWCDDVELRPK